MAAILAAACVLIISPALAQNWSISHTLAIQGYGGLNFYIGNSPLHTGRATFRLGAGWDALNSEAAQAGISDPAAQDRYYVARTLADIRERPAAFLKLLSLKALWVLQAEEARDSHSYYFFTDRLPLLRLLPRMVFLLPFAAIGLFPLIRQRRRTSLLLYVGVAAFATAVFLVVGTRYRMPLLPVLAIAAGAGLDVLGHNILVRRARSLVLYTLTAVTAICVSHLLNDPQNHNLAEEWAFTGSSLITEHNLAGADVAYRRALALDPDSGLAWDGLGLVNYNSGRLPEARDAFSRALAIDKGSARATFHVALLDQRQGDLPKAEAGYRRTLDLSPFDIDAVVRLGEVLMAENKPSEALPYLRTAAEQMSNDADAHRALATALAMTDQPASALPEMRRVVELTPANGEAWLDLCLMSLDAHEVRGAALALERARDLGASPERLAFASAALERAGK
jgi:tetratricopeptide (TPR) repeat protein